MKMKTKIIISSIVSGVFILSVSFNIYWIKRSFEEKKATDDIVNVIMDPIIDDMNSDNDELNTKHNDVITEINNEFENTDVFDNESDFTDEILPEQKIVYSNINGKQYEMILSNNIEKSHKQTIFFSDLFGNLLIAYQDEANKRNEIITVVDGKLTDGTNEIINQISENEINDELASFRKNVFRFGVDLGIGFKFGTVPTVGLNISSIDVGLGGLIMDKIDVKVTAALGLELENSSFGVSIGYYF